MKDKKILLKACDGPENIEIYTSEDEGVVDWAPTQQPVYVCVTTHDASFKAGPFTLSSIFYQLVCQLKNPQL